MFANHEQPHEIFELIIGASLEQNVKERNQLAISYIIQ